jgi:hypothetical protein
VPSQDHQAADLNEQPTSLGPLCALPDQPMLLQQRRRMWCIECEDQGPKPSCKPRACGCFIIFGVPHTLQSADFVLLRTQLMQYILPASSTFQAAHWHYLGKTMTAHSGQEPLLNLYPFGVGPLILMLLCNLLRTRKDPVLSW